jgi:phytoene desaturase
MEEEGITVKLNQDVTAFTYEGRRITGVTTACGGHYHADSVISNMDPSHLYRKVIPSQQQHVMTKLKTRTAKHSMGLFVLYFGTTKQFPDVVHHTIWLGKRYKPLLDDIFNAHKLADDFSLYVHRPTATDPSFAPEGCDSFYVLSPVPNLAGDVDWEHEGEAYAQKILDALDKSIMPGVKDSVAVQFHMTPQDFAHDYHTHLGTGFSIAPTLTQSAWFRYHNRAEGFDNLYLVGAGTHPGAGMPGVLCSAKVLDKLIPAQSESLAHVS